MFGLLGVFTRAARTFTQGDIDFLQGTAAALAEDIAWKRGELARHRHSEDLELKTSWLSLLQDVTRAANEAESLDEAISDTLKSFGKDGRWQFGQSYLRVPGEVEMLAPFQSWVSEKAPSFESLRQATQTLRFRRGDNLPGRLIEKVRPLMVHEMTKAMFPTRFALVRDLGVKTVMALPVHVGGEVVAVLEFFSTQHIPEDPSVLDLYAHVGTQLGRVVERMRFNEAYADGIWEEQKHFAEELHDSVGQELMALDLMAQAHLKSLEGKRAALQEGDRIAKGIQQVSEKVGRLARGLFPVEVDAEGLVSALEHLANGTTSLYGIPCKFSREAGIAVSEKRVAAQIFRIAQEAIANAVHHAKARTLQISLHPDGGILTLEVNDDGRGMSVSPKARKGLGLRIMRNRAASIGGTLTIESAPKTGTRVICTVPGATPIRSGDDTGASPRRGDAL